MVHQRKMLFQSLLAEFWFLQKIYNKVNNEKDKKILSTK